MAIPKPRPPRLPCGCHPSWARHRAPHATRVAGLGLTERIPPAWVAMAATQLLRVGKGSRCGCVAWGVAPEVRLHTQHHTSTANRRPQNLLRAAVLEVLRGESQRAGILPALRRRLYQSQRQQPRPRRGCPSSRKTNHLAKVAMRSSRLHWRRACRSATALMPVVVCTLRPCWSRIDPPGDAHSKSHGTRWICSSALT